MSEPERECVCVSNPVVVSKLFRRSRHPRRFVCLPLYRPIRKPHHTQSQHPRTPFHMQAGRRRWWLVAAASQMAEPGQQARAAGASAQAVADDIMEHHGPPPHDVAAAATTPDADDATASAARLLLQHPSWLAALQEPSDLVPGTYETPGHFPHSIGLLPPTHRPVRL